MSKPLVFVIQESEKDFRDAERFGDLVFLTHRDLNNIPGSAHNEELITHIAHTFNIHNFNPATDYLIITGSPSVTAAVFMLLGNWGLKDVKLLRWDNRDRNYTPMQINLTRKHCNNDL
jgi:hypothetical protein